MAGTLREARERAFSARSRDLDSDVAPGQLEKDNFNLKMRVYYLEEQLRKSGVEDTSLESVQLREMEQSWRQKSERDRAALESLRETMSEELRKSQTSLQAERQRVAHLQTRLESLERALAGQKISLEESQREADAASAAEAKLWADNRELKRKFQEATYGLEALKHVQPLLEQSSTARDQLRRALEDEKARSAILEEQLATAKRRGEELTVENETSKREFATLQQTAEQVAAIEAEEIAKLEQQMQQAQQQLKKKDALLAQKEATIKSVERETALGRQREAVLQRQLEERDAMLAKARTDLIKQERDLTVELSKVAKECVELRRMNRTLAETCEKLSQSMVERNSGFLRRSTSSLSAYSPTGTGTAASAHDASGNYGEDGLHAVSTPDLRKLRIQGRARMAQDERARSRQARRSPYNAKISDLEHGSSSYSSPSVSRQLYRTNGTENGDGYA